MCRGSRVWSEPEPAVIMISPLIITFLMTAGSQDSRHSRVIKPILSIYVSLAGREGRWWSCQVLLTVTVL